METIAGSEETGSLVIASNLPHGLFRTTTAAHFLVVDPDVDSIR